VKGRVNFAVHQPSSFLKLLSRQLLELRGCLAALLPLAGDLDGLSQPDLEIDGARTLGNSRPCSGARAQVALQHHRCAVDRRLPALDLCTAHEHSRRMLIRMSEYGSERNWGRLWALIGQGVHRRQLKRENCGARAQPSCGSHWSLLCPAPRGNVGVDGSVTRARTLLNITFNGLEAHQSLERQS
jgi:hypothetical protein